MVTGSAWVSGADGIEQRIEAGYGALLAAGEDHAVRSPDGLIAVCIEGTFDVWAVTITGDIVVADYDPRVAAVV